MSAVRAATAASKHGIESPVRAVPEYGPLLPLDQTAANSHFPANSLGLFAQKPDASLHIFVAHVAASVLGNHVSWRVPSQFSRKFFLTHRKHRSAVRHLFTQKTRHFRSLVVQSPAHPVLQSHLPTLALTEVSLARRYQWALRPTPQYAFQWL